MAITAAELPIRRLALPLLLVVSVSCVSGSVPANRTPTGPVPAPPLARQDPEIRIGILVGRPAATLGGMDALVVGEPDGSRVATIPAGETWEVTLAGPRLVLHGTAGWISAPL
ncbi:MAG TPA: hypothetical protein VIG95_04055, partial [Gemmatimonadales bacterium]